MRDLPTFHGHITDLRRHVNVHHSARYRHLHGPGERYELWIQPPKGRECKFTVHSRTMPARRGHEVSVVLATYTPLTVLGLVNWSALDGANYVWTDSPPLLRERDLWMFGVSLACAALGWGVLGVYVFLQFAAVCGLVMCTVRAVIRRRLGNRVALAMQRESWRLGTGPRSQKWLSALMG